MSKHEAEISPSAMLYRTVAIKRQHPNSMLSRRPTPYYFDYTVVLHSHPSAIKTFISLNCDHYNRPDRIRQDFVNFYQKGLVLVWFRKVLVYCKHTGKQTKSPIPFRSYHWSAGQLIHNFSSSYSGANASRNLVYLLYKCRGSFIYCPLTLSSIHF